jgi:DNA-binding PadR family transcriptional regulator
MTTTHLVPAMDTVEYWQALYRKSLLRFFLLSELAKRPAHGYEIGSFVAVCCDWQRPADAMIYPTLRELEEGGYISCEEAEVAGRRRKVCSLTGRGLEAYRAAARAWARALPQIELAIRAAGADPECSSGAPVSIAPLQQKKAREED